MSKSKPDPLAWISPPLRAFAVPIAELTPDPGNARRHPTYNLEAIRRSLERFGQQKPIVCSADRIVRCGNGTLAAALAAGRTMIAAVISDLSPAEIEAYAIADNRSGELAEWDPERLKAALGRMPADLQAAAGWDGDALRRALKMPAVEDEPPAAPSTPISRTGDLWTLGGHRLLCGDSTDDASVLRVMGGHRARLVLTDPPYGVSYVGGTKDAMEIENDGSEGLRELLEKSLGLAFKVCEPGAVWYVAAPSGPQSADFVAVLSGLKVWRQTLAWVKDSMVLGHSDYHYRHEAVYYGWVPGADHSRPPTRNCTSVLEFDRPKASRDHPTMKPVALWAHLMGNSTVGGDVCYEPFSGSGTTIVAAEQLGRRCFAIEIDPRYVDVAVNRWEALTGQRAALEDGTDPRTAPR